MYDTTNSSAGCCDQCVPQEEERNTCHVQENLEQYVNDKFTAIERRVLLDTPGEFTKEKLQAYKAQKIIQTKLNIIILVLLAISCC